MFKLTRDRPGTYTATVDGAPVKVERVAEGRWVAAGPDGVCHQAASYRDAKAALVSTYGLAERDSRVSGWVSQPGRFIAHLVPADARAAVCGRTSRRWETAPAGRMRCLRCEERP